MEDPDTDSQTRLTDDGQKVLLLPEFSQLFFDADGNFRSRNDIFGRVFTGGAVSKRLVLLCLGLLNAVLLIVAVAIGINCAKVKEGSLHVSHATAKQLFSELNYLRGNHSDVMEAKEASMNAFKTALGNHTQLKEKIEQLKTMNDDYSKQIPPLQTERTNLKANFSDLGGNCGRCPSGWFLSNSSCYFHSKSASIPKLNWHRSLDDCISRGANLTVIETWEEQRNLFEFLPKLDPDFGPRWRGTWIGLTDFHKEGHWVWLNNVTLQGRGYWFPGEPNNYGSREGEDSAALMIIRNPRATWFDANCQETKDWLCEMEPN